MTIKTKIRLINLALLLAFWAALLACVYGEESCGIDRDKLAAQSRWLKEQQRYREAAEMINPPIPELSFTQEAVLRAALAFSRKSTFTWRELFTNWVIDVRVWGECWPAPGGRLSRSEVLEFVAEGPTRCHWRRVIYKDGVRVCAGGMTGQ